MSLADLFQFLDFRHALQIAAELPSVPHTLGIGHEPASHTGHGEFLFLVLGYRHSAVAQDVVPFFFDADVRNNNT